MRKNLGIKTYIYPQPVLIISTYNEDGSANAMNAAWGMVSDYNQLTLCLSASHKTVKNALRDMALVVNIPDVKHVKEADYFGVVSGNDVADKVKHVGFTTTKSDFVNAPIINELSLALECEVLKYDTESELMTVKIMNVSCDENILDSHSKIDLTKLEVIAFDPANHSYIRLGDKVGNAFKDGLELK